MKQITFFLLSICLISLNISAQQHGNLPKGLTPEEREMMPEYLEQIKNSSRSGITTPPTSPVRTAAEWEEAQAICITWTSYTSILREIVRYAKEECTVYIICSNPTTVTNYLTAGGVTVDESIVMITAPYNSVWMRDYGPEAGYLNDVETLIINDWIYNRPRPLDDVLPEVIATQAGVPIYEMTQSPYDIIHTGGNFMCDGLGTGFSSNLVLDENPTKSEAEIDDVMQQFMGINRYIKMPVLPYDGIHHIDMHMKLIDEETLLVGQYPAGVSDGPQIAANINYVVNNFTTAFGNQYKVVNIPMPPSGNGGWPSSGGDYRTYANSIFINKTILVPTYSEQYDTTALRIYRENLPGYNVIGINCNSIITASGALHCITKLVYSDDPLLIAHPKLRDTYFTDSRTVLARIQHASGISSATLYWSTSITDPPSPYPVEMTLTDPANHIWTGTIPAQPEGATVTYYIEATAVSGKTQVRPITAPEGMYQYKVLELTEAPATTFNVQGNSTVCPGQSIQYMDYSSPAVTAWSWSFPGGTPATSTEQNPTVFYNSPGTYSATLMATNPIGSNSYTLPNAVVVQPLTGIAPFTENFSGGIPASFTITNTTGDSYTWTLQTGTSCNGNALRINNFNNSNTGTTDIVSVSVDLTQYTVSSLTFSVAYAPYNSSYFDRLKVLVDECGTNGIEVYNKAGSVLATAPSTTSAFTPSGCSQWRNETVDLSAFDGQVVRINFVNVNGHGNYLYLDNISVQGNFVPTVEVKIKALLQGPYNALINNMTNNLLTSSLLPLTQTFNRNPWNYSGNEFATNIGQLPPNTVDWVLVQVRNGTNPAILLAEKAAVILQDGTIRDAVGSSTGVSFNGIAPGSNYYVSLHHRNHVSILSSVPVQLPNTVVYDFSASEAAVSNQRQLIQVGLGKYALCAGDFDGDGVVTVHDFNYYYPQNGMSGQYLDGDLNFDASVNATDFDLYRGNSTKIGVNSIRY
ncbi:MAG: agmatine deiminase family protein [Sphingobacteriales bacterium]|nr:MAG: agmatine deiminase family protein [Sphingobacteriales bacterium]